MPPKRQDFGDCAAAYYHEHHAGLTRMELKKRDRGLYERLKRERKLDVVPRRQALSTDPVGFYHKYHAGLTRAKLRKKNPCLYQKLKEDGELWHVPRERRFHCGEDLLG